METHNLSSFTGSDAAITHDTKECLYLMSDVESQESMSEHIQLVNKQQKKKTAMAEIQVGSHATQFIFDSGAPCNIMCGSKYEKMKHKPSLLPFTIEVLTWGVRQPVINMGKFVETLTYHNISVQEEVHVLQRDVPVMCLPSNVTSQVMGLLAITHHIAERQNILK
ncbi:hypothetical protein NDU88_001925 [Pleurodeles waltl]|uniref:Uncharacterized protein n=1 Tax=Pleurodeles waltl TaxID=8319 RepID=A0AAV7P599_PLEWA|nr:hypothetical protein NDU88_001925 [Pleurodeles waltl]